MVIQNTKRFVSRIFAFLTRKTFTSFREFTLYK